METVTHTMRARGMAALDAGDLDQAVDWLSRAVLQDPSDAEARARLAVAYGRKGMHEQARRALGLALGLQPENPDFLCLLGAQHEREGDTAAAAAAYREALRHRPDHATALARLELVGADPAVAAPAAAPEAHRPPTPAPPAAQEASFRGAGLRCGRCGEWSQPGVLCEWCGASLAAGVVPPAVEARGEVQAAVARYATGLPPLVPLVHRRANRGPAALALGITSLVLSLLGFGCVFPSFLGVALGGVAASVGGRDLAGIREGAVQEYGSGSLVAGRVLGILGIVAGLAGLALWGVLVLFSVVVFGL